MSAYLIQRGTIKTVKPEEVIGIDSLVHFDYMGSAEFEFGTLPKALTELVSCTDLVLVDTKIKSWDGLALMLLCRKVDVTEVIKQLNTFATKPELQRTKEPVYLKRRLNKPDNKNNYGQEYDFWWAVDTGACWMAILGKNKSELLVKAIDKVREKKGITAPAIEMENIK